MATEPTICDEIETAVTHRVSIVQTVIPTHGFSVGEEHAYAMSKTNTAWVDFEFIPENNFVIYDVNAYVRWGHQRMPVLVEIVNNSNIDATVLITGANLIKYITPPPPLTERTPPDLPVIDVTANVTYIVMLEYMGPDGSYSQQHYWHTTASGAPLSTADSPASETVSQVMLRCYDHNAFRAFFVDRLSPNTRLPGDYKLFIGLVGVQTTSTVQVEFGGTTNTSNLDGSAVDIVWNPHTSYESIKPQHYTRKWTVKTVDIAVEKITTKSKNYYEDHPEIPPYYTYTIEAEYNNKGTYTYPEVPNGKLTLNWFGATDHDEPDAITPERLIERYQPSISYGDGVYEVFLNWTKFGIPVSRTDYTDNYQILWPGLEAVPADDPNS